MAHLIGFLNPKGGSGKSTLTTNVARALQEAGHSVLIVDTDPQGTVRDWQSQQESQQDEPLVDVVSLDPIAAPKTLPALGRSYDVVLLDGASKVEARATAALVRSLDLIVIPCRPSAADVWGASDLAQIIHARREITGGQPKAFFAITFDAAGTHLSREIEAAIAEQEMEVLKARISNRPATYPDAIGAGLGVTDLQPNGKAASEIRALTAELLSHVS